MTSRPPGGKTAENRPAARPKLADLPPTNSLLVHDIKNLSFRLGSLLHNLEANYDDPLFKKTVIDILADTVSRMDRIIHRCQAPKEDLIVKYPVDMNEVLNEMIDRVPRALQNKSLIEENYERVPKIWADPKYLKEAFFIITENALQAMQESGGRLAISTAAAMDRSGKRKVIVKIADTGGGMSREFVRNHLFAPFVTTKKSGLGLGLYSCRKIISLHDGRIRVTSRPGKGTTFRIDFPAAGQE